MPITCKNCGYQQDVEGVGANMACPSCGTPYDPISLKDEVLRAYRFRFILFGGAAGFAYFWLLWNLEVGILGLFVGAWLGWFICHGLRRGSTIKQAWSMAGYIACAILFARLFFTVDPSSDIQRNSNVAATSVPSLPPPPSPAEIEAGRNNSQGIIDAISGHEAAFTTPHATEDQIEAAMAALNSAAFKGMESSECYGLRHNAWWFLSQKRSYYHSRHAPTGPREYIEARDRLILSLSRCDASLGSNTRLAAWIK